MKIEFNITLTTEQEQEIRDEVERQLIDEVAEAYLKEYGKKIMSGINYKAIIEATLDKISNKITSDYNVRG